MAVPEWQLPQLGSWNQPTRAEEPTWLMLPWQLWHCMAIDPSDAMAAPMAPRKHLVAEPGWHR